jgi:hypothetical protein
LCNFVVCLDKLLPRKLQFLLVASEALFERRIGFEECLLLDKGYFLLVVNVLASEHLSNFDCLLNQAKLRSPLRLFVLDDLLRRFQLSVCFNRVQMGLGYMLCVSSELMVWGKHSQGALAHGLIEHAQI